MMSTVFALTRQPQTQHGVGLVDLMVGMTLGLVLALMMVQVAVMFESRRHAAAGMADAHLNAVLAMGLITRELRMTGRGLGPPPVWQCQARRALGTVVATDLALWPITIVNGSGGGPDSVLTLASAKPQALPATRLVAAYAPGDTSVLLDSPLDIESDDWLVLQQPATCLLIRARSVATGGYRVWHDPLPSGLVPTAGFASGSTLANLGAMHRLQFQIGPNATLVQAKYDPLTDRWSQSTLVSAIVSLQAQYGFDARPGAQPNPQVNFWSDTLIDADANGVIGDAGDLLRVLAVRIALVARSSVLANEVCDATAPQWLAGNSVTGILETRLINVSFLPNWRCYRYRVLQDEVPLRNLIWNDA